MMTTRAKHSTEITEELDSLRGVVMDMGEKQDQIQSQIDEVQGRLRRVDVLELKMDNMEALLVKNEQVQTEIFDYLKKTEIFVSST